MDTTTIMETPPKLQGWIRGLKAAAEASGIGVKTLRKLANAGEICAYQNPDHQRGRCKGGEGEWFFHGPSLHDYHLRKSGLMDLREATLDVIRRAGL
ncbi:MAG: hypothetical protein K9K66_19245 [Desulfarculaceae bacterium]|nr:hypothetical protein [Desulfarculaceae bacterium]MCF8103793.1 hypothetical protein [Desulfarculaceae bacterium]